MDRQSAAKHDGGSEFIQVEKSPTQGQHLELVQDLAIGLLEHNYGRIIDNDASPSEKLTSKTSDLSCGNLRKPERNYSRTRTRKPTIHATSSDTHNLIDTQAEIDAEAEEHHGSQSILLPENFDIPILKREHGYLMGDIEDTKDPTKLSKAVEMLLQAGELLSSCSLNVCIAVAGQERIQFWTSSDWRDDLKQVMKQSTNIQAGLNQDNTNVDMFVKTGPQFDYMKITTSIGSGPDVERMETGHIINRSQGDVVVKNVEILDPDATSPEAEKPSSLSEEETLKIYDCDICDFSTSLFRNLRAHKTSHQKDEKPHKCPQCDYRVELPSALRRHMTVHTGEKPFSCELCSYRATRPFLVKKHHRNVHLGEKDFKCDVCDFSAHYSKSLIDHKRIHTGETLICDHCGYQTCSSTNFSRHKRKHTRETLQCEVCGYEAYRLEHLRVHMRRHTGEKPIKCKLCDYSTAHNKSFIAHMITHTGEWFVCDVCGYKTNRNHNLVKHTRSCHARHNQSNPDNS